MSKSDVGVLGETNKKKKTMITAHCQSLAVLSPRSTYILPTIRAFLHLAGRRQVDCNVGFFCQAFT